MRKFWKLFWPILAAVLIVIALTATQARAETFTYACEIVVDLRFETHLAKIDEQKHTFHWRGKTYQITVNPGCGKYGWHVSGHGTSFDFCAATKGVGSFSVNQKALRTHIQKMGLSVVSS